MNKFTNEEIEQILGSVCITDTNVLGQRPKAYSILINGKLFKTDKGKTIWKQKNHAMAALNNQVKYLVEGLIKTKLQTSGVNKSFVWRHPEYLSAWEDFKKEIIEKGILTIIELQ